MGKSRNPEVCEPRIHSLADSPTHRDLDVLSFVFWSLYSGRRIRRTRTRTREAKRPFVTDINLHPARDRPPHPESSPSTPRRHPPGLLVLFVAFGSRSPGKNHVAQCAETLVGDHELSLQHSGSRRLMRASILFRAPNYVDTRIDG